MNHFHIGVDARPLSMPITGIGQYTYQLLKILPTLGYCWTFYSNKPLIVDLPKQENVRIVTGKPSIFNKSIVWSQTILPALIYKDAPDVFWSPRHHLPLLTRPSLPMVVTIHDIVYKLFSQTVRKGNFVLESLLLPYAVKRAQKIIAVSQTTKRDLIQHLQVPANKIKVIYPGVTAQTEISLPRNHLETYGITKPYILFLGTLEPRKNILRLIQAYAKLPENLRAQYQLVLAGGMGWGNDNPLPLIDQLPLKNEVILPGYVSETLRCTLLHHAYVFAMPSLYEGFGSPVVEAMQAGVPVLTSARGATAEISDNAACLVDPYAVDDITRGLEKCLIHSAYRQKLIEAGKKQQESFSWEVAAKQTLNTLLETSK